MGSAAGPVTASPPDPNHRRGGPAKGPPPFLDEPPLASTNPVGSIESGYADRGTGGKRHDSNAAIEEDQARALAVPGAAPTSGLSRGIQCRARSRTWGGSSRAHHPCGRTGGRAGAPDRAALRTRPLRLRGTGGAPRVGEKDSRSRSAREIHHRGRYFPRFSKTVTVLEAVFAVTRSGHPSRFRSPAATD